MRRAPTGYVDRLLAQADGALATIWITGLYAVRRIPPPQQLRCALQRLVAESPRLQLVWSQPKRSWMQREAAPMLQPSVADLGVAPYATLVRSVLAHSVDLATQIPFRVSFGKYGDGQWLLALQLHHAIGDGRSAVQITQRYFDLLSTATPPAATALASSVLGNPQATDARVLLAALRSSASVRLLTHPAYRILAARGPALRRATTPHIGTPSLRGLVVQLPPNVGTRAAAGLFFGALLALCNAMREHASRAPFRLRIPVDLRRHFTALPSLENACSAVAVEVSQAEVAAWVAAGPAGAMQLRARVPNAIAQLVAAGAHWPALLECMAVSRFASRAQLREHLVPDLLAKQRASTLVATFMGALDHYFDNPAIDLIGAQSHTPTWGATGFTLHGKLVINLNCFEGLWNEAETEQALAAMRDWLRDGCNLQVSDCPTAPEAA